MQLFLQLNAQTFFITRNNDVDSDDEDDEPPPLLNDPDDDSDLHVNYDESNFNDVLGVTRRVRFVDDDDAAGVTNDKEAIETVEHVKRKLTNRDQLKSETMRRFQHVARHPLEIIICSINTNGIKNSIMTRRDLLLAKEVLGARNHAIQGKTARSNPDIVGVSLFKIDVLKSTMTFYKDVELATDPMHANDVQ